MSEMAADRWADTVGANPEVYAPAAPYAAAAALLIGGGPVLAALGSEALAAIRVGAGVAQNARRVEEIHKRLDPIAQRQRTTARLEVKEGKAVVAGGKRDLTPAQRDSLTKNEIAARDPKLHAERTALKEAKEQGLSPSRMNATRDFCAECRREIENSGGKITGSRSAEWD
ncbi:MAG: hypothetical protein IPK27_15690 [Rhodanobacteraceae bacterium]|nr:hypothetical protein [Rhodanobacteraceae bacterium]